MSKTRPELSKNNKYHVDKNRYYELLYFCRQYNIWKKAYDSLSGLASRPAALGVFVKSGISNPTERCAISREAYLDKMHMVDQACLDTDEVLGWYILRGIIENKSYDILRTTYQIPCGKNMYYELYRKFFWILDKLKD